MHIGTAMEGLKTIYQTIRSDRKKERYEMILEPFQAIVQLALLSYCPVGTRLAISSNLLSIQTPSITTSITRSYYQDCRDDLVYLFSVITRFYKFYGYMSTRDSTEHNLFNTLIYRGKIGLDKIIQTYANTDHGSLIQQLKMYKAMLDRSELYDDRSLAKDCERDDVDARENIDEIFIQIRDLYEPPLFLIIQSTLELIKANPEDYQTYMDTVNAAMKPTCILIQKWIHSKIIL